MTKQEATSMKKMVVLSVQDKVLLLVLKKVD